MRDRNIDREFTKMNEDLLGGCDFDCVEDIGDIKFAADIIGILWIQYHRIQYCTLHVSELYLYCISRVQDTGAATQHKKKM